MSYEAKSNPKYLVTPQVSSRGALFVRRDLHGKTFAKMFAKSPRTGWRSLVAKSAPRDDNLGSHMNFMGLFVIK